MNKPLFSVLIANYNNGHYLMAAIDSVRKQTYDNWEIVLVDDGSTDTSKALYEDLGKDERIRIFFNEKNYGCAYTKHQCVLKAQGKYCGYLDPDDELLPCALEVSVKRLEENENASLLFTRNYICDTNMNVIGESRPLVLPEGVSYFENRDYSAESFASFPTAKYLQMGGIDISCKAGVDADLYFRLEECGELLIENAFTYKYRTQNKNSILGNWSRAFYWNLMVRHNTCIRRGLPVEKFAYADFVNYVNERIESELWLRRPYRIGKFLMNPMAWLRHLRKNRQKGK